MSHPTRDPDPFEETEGEPGTVAQLLGYIRQQRSLLTSVLGPGVSRGANLRRDLVLVEYDYAIGLLEDVGEDRRRLASALDMLERRGLAGDPALGMGFVASLRELTQCWRRE